VAVKLDRLGRSTRDVFSVVHELEGKGAAVTVLEPAFSTKDATGSILVTMLGMVAEMDRRFLRERQQARSGCGNPILNIGAPFTLPSIHCRPLNDSRAEATVQ
jgi:hypothetical protein